MVRNSIRLPTVFRLVRLPNLLIVAVTQYLLQYFVLLPMLEEAGLSPTLDGFHFFLLVFDTVLIAAGGYLVNDILDYEMDVLNKPGKVFINQTISRQQAVILYVLLSLTGLEIAWYLAGHVSNRTLFAIYPVAVGLLWLYSRDLKKIPLAGNLLVSLFCAFVAGVVLFAERELFAQITAQQPDLARRISILFSGYLLFAFLSTMLREIVKDIEDMEGDRQLGLRTLPISFGQKTARNWALAFNGLLLFASIIFANWLFQNNNWPAFAFTFAGVILPLIYTSWLLVKAVGKDDFSRLSQLIKYVMLAGLMLLVLC